MVDDLLIDLCHHFAPAHLRHGKPIRLLACVAGHQVSQRAHSHRLGAVSQQCLVRMAVWAVERVDVGDEEARQYNWGNHRLRLFVLFLRIIVGSMKNDIFPAQGLV